MVSLPGGTWVDRETGSKRAGEARTPPSWHSQPPVALDTLSPRDLEAREREEARWLLGREDPSVAQLRAVFGATLDRCRTRIIRGARGSSQFEAIVAWTIRRLEILGVGRVAVLGVGPWSSALLPAWRAWRGPAIDRLLIDSPGIVPDWPGIQATPLADYDGPAEAIVLCADHHGLEHDEAAARRFPRLPVLPLHFRTGCGPNGPAEQDWFDLRRLLPWVADRMAATNVASVILRGREDSLRRAEAIWKAWGGAPIEDHEVADVDAEVLPAEPRRGTVTVAAPAVPTSKPRCLMVYPWPLDERIGARALLSAYSHAVRDMGYRVDCIAPVRSAEARLDDLRLGVFEEVFIASALPSGFAAALDLAGLITPDPALPDQHGRDSATWVAAASLAASGGYDVVGIHYARCHSILPLLPARAVPILFTHELDAQVAQQMRDVFGAATEYSIADEAERLARFPLVTVVGPDDAAALRAVKADLPLVEAPFCAPVPRSPEPAGSADGTLLWVSSGALFHELSFRWFWAHAWPRLMEARPRTHLILAGRICETAERLGAAEHPNVTLHGVVEDLETLYLASDVVVCPYYYGFGIKTKIIEALVSGLPVVTTPLGLLNTRLTPGADVAVAEDGAGLVAEVVRLLDDPSARRTMAAAGRTYVERHHDARTAYRDFAEALERLRGSWNTATQSAASPELARRTHWAVHRSKAAGDRRVAFYGAGSHTAMLLPLWRELGGAEPACIVVTRADGRGMENGLPLVSADAFDPVEVDAIVLSSHRFESDMAAECAKRWPRLRVHRLWTDGSAGAAALAPRKLAIQDRIPELRLGPAPEDV